MKPKFFLAKSIATLIATTITLTSSLHALPQGEQVQAGTAAFSRTGAALNITTSDRAIINYQSFSIGAAERVNFVQPSVQSITLNRVTAPNPSQILGSLSSNGQIVLANPYGIYFGSGAVVNVGGLIAGAGRISDSDFLAGRINFSSLSGDVENHGRIISITDVGLYGEHVTNTGSISSQKGSVTLAAGSSVYVGEAGGNIFVGSAAAIPKARVVSKPGVTNTGRITAPKATLVAGDMYGIAIAQSGDIISGDITIAAGAGGGLDVSGRLDASNRTPGKTGGKIKVKGETITVHDATLDASGAAGGGSIILDGGHNAATPTTVTSSGTITARGTGTGAKGGSVQMLGDHVGLLGNAVVDVSGDAGGGTALIGGDYQGKNPDIQNAARTYISLGSKIYADALSIGDGGKVIVWSDDVTRFYGSISVRGGATSGNGGFAEVSGKATLDYNGAADARAPHGRAGTLLLDPLNITVQAANPDLNGDATLGDDLATNSLPFGAPPAAGTSIITGGAVATQMNTATVVLQATNNILINAPIDASANVGNGFGLTLQAGNNITVAAGSAITTRGGALNFTARDAGGTQGAAASISIASALDTTAGGQLGGGVTLFVNGGTGSVAVNASITTAGAANVSITGGSGGVTQVAASTVNAGTGTITINGGGGAINLNTGTLTTTNAGATAVSIRGGTTVALGNVTAAAGTLVLGVGADITGAVTQNAAASLNVNTVTASTAGSIDLTGNGGGANTIANLGAVTRGGALTVVDTTGGLNVTGAITGGTTSNAVTITTAGGVLDVGASITTTTGAGNLILTGAGVNQSAGTLLVSGTTTVNAGLGVISLTQATNDFTGGVTLNATGATVSIRDTNALTLAAPTLGANTGITAIAGTTLTLPAATNFNTGTGNIDFRSNGGTLATTGTLTTTTGTITLVGSTGLTVAHAPTTTSGDITLTGGGAGGLVVNAGITVDAGNATITASGGTGAIQLNTSTLTTTNATATAVTVRNATTVALGNVTAAAGTLVLGVGADITGAVTQNAAASLNVNTVTASTAGSIDLTGNGGGANTIANLGAVTRGGALTVVDTTGGLNVTGAITGGTTSNAVTITTAGGVLDVGASITTTTGAGNLILTGAGVNQSAGTLLVSGTTTVNAGLGVISLTQATNDFTGGVTLNATGATVSIRDTNALTLAAPTLGANTGITAIAGTTLTLPAATNFNTGTGNIDFRSNGGTLATTGTLTTTTGTITLVGSTGLTVAHAPTTTSGDITLTGGGAGGLVVNAGITVDAGNATITASGGTGAIQLNTSTLTTTNATATAVTVRNATTVALGNVTAAAGTLVLGVGADITGAVTQNAAASLNVNTVTASTAGSIDLTGNGGGANTIANLGAVTRGGALTVVDTTGGLNVTGAITGGTTSNAVTITTAGGVLDVGASITTTTGAGNLILTGAGVNQSAGTLLVSGTTTVNAGLGVISLTQATNDFTGGVTLNATGATVSIRDTNALTLAAPTLGANTGITAIAGTTLTLPAATNFNTGTGNIDFRSNGGTLATTGTLTTTTGTITLVGSTGLTVAHAPTTTSGDITLTGGGAGGLVVNAGITVDAGNATITASGGTGAIQLNTSTLTTTNATATAVTVRNATTVALGNVTAAAGTLVLGVGADITGAVTQNAAASLNVNTVTASTAGSIDLTGNGGGANTIANLGAVTRGGALTVVDTTGGLNVTGAITGGTTSNAVTITTAGGALVINAGSNISATGGANAVSLTGVGITNGATVTGTGGITVNALTGTFDNSAGTLTTSNTNNLILITANDWVLGAVANSITTGVSGGGVTIDRTANAQINLGTNLTTAELGTVTTSGNFTIGSAGNTGGVDIAANVAFGATTPNVKLLSGAGAITDAAGAFTISATNLDMTAANGIGSAGNEIKTTVSGNLSATNTTNGNIFLAPTGGVTLGGPGVFIDEQVLNGTISVVAGGAIVIAGNVTVSGGGASTVILDATGTITELSAGAGTVTAATVRLGTAGTTTAIGVSAGPVPVLTAATTLLDARSSAGDVVVSNTGNVNATAQATGGLVNLANTGTLTTTGAGITSSTSSVTVISTDDMSIGHAITGPTGVTLTVSGAEKTLTHTAGAIDGTNAAITLTADKMALTGGTIGNAIGDIVTLKGNLAGNAINLGSAVDTTANTLELSNAELNTITGALTIGSTVTTGAITVGTAVNVAGATGGLTLLNRTNGIAVNAALTSPAALVLTANGGGAATGAITGNGAISATLLNANAATGITLGGASTVQSVTLTNTTGGNISYTGSAVGAANTLTVSGSNTGTAAGGSFTVTETTGELTAAAAGITTRGGDISLTTQKAGGLLTVTGSVDTTVGSAAGANVLLRGDVLAIPGTVNAGTAGNVQLRPQTLGNTIGVEDAGQAFNVTNLMLGQITVTNGTITIGDTIADPTHTGNISVARDNAITQGAKNITLSTLGVNTANIAITGNNDFTAKNLTLRAGGAITQAAGMGRLVTQNAGDLVLNATAGIGSLAGPAPILIGALAGNLSAVNTTTGNIVLSTGPITLGVAGAVIDEQVVGGTISVTSSGNITIGGNLSVSGGGASTIILNATGDIIRTAGTITAQNVNLTGVGIGTNPARIFTAGTGIPPFDTLTLSAGTGGAFVNHTGSVTLAAPVLGAGASITVTSTGTLTLPAVALTLTGAGAIDFESNGGTLATAGTLTTAAGNITLVGSAGLTVGHNLTSTSGNFSLTGGPAGGVTVNAGIAVNAGSGTITLDGGGSTVQLNDSTLTTTSALAPAVDIRNATTVGLGSISAVNGTLRLGLAGVGNIITGAVTQNVNTSINANTVTATTTNDVNLTATGAGANNIDVVGPINIVDALARRFTLVDSTLGLTVNGDITVTGAINPNAGVFITTTGGALSVTAAPGTVTVNVGDIVLRSTNSDVLLAGVLSASGLVQLDAGGAGVISQTAGSITGLSLIARAPGNVTLIQAGNDVTNLAGASTGGTFSYRDATALTVGTVSDVALVNVVGLTTTNQDITVVAGAGLVTGGLAINAPVNAGAGAGGGIVRLQTERGDITQGVVPAGTITGRSLLANATVGSVSLGSVTNNVSASTLAGTANGSFRFLNLGALSIGSIAADPNAITTAANGVTSTTSDIAIQAGGALALNQAVNAPAGTIRLRTTAGDISQVAAGSVVGNALLVDAAGAVLLADPLAANNVANLAGRALAGPFSYRDINDVTVTNLTADGAGLGPVLPIGPLSGVATPGAATLISGGTLNLAVPLTAIGSLDAFATTAIDINGGGPVTVQTNAGQTYNNAVILTANTLLVDTGASAIRFLSTVDSDAAVTPRSLEVRTGGETRFGSGGAHNVGGNNALLSVITDGFGTTVFDITGATTATPTVRTTTFQTYNDAVTLVQNSVFTSTLGGDVTFTGTVDSFNATARSLEVNTGGATRFGNSSGLAAGTVFANLTSGRLGGNFALLSVLTDAPAAGVAAGAANITVFDITGAATGAPSVRTTGSQIYNEAVQLSLNTVLESTAGGNVVFTNSVDSRTATARSLEINTSGVTRFGNVTGPAEALGLLTSGPVGGNFALLSLLTDAPLALVAAGAGNITMFDIAGAGTATPSVRTTGSQIYNEAVQLSLNTVLESTAGGNVVFTNSVDSRTATARSLEINTFGATRFGNVTGPTEALGLVNSGRVGGINSLLSLLTDAPAAGVAAGAGNITMFDIAGAGTGTPSVRTSGFQIYNEAVQLSLNTVLESTAGGNVVFTNTVDSRTATGRFLEINTSGATRFGNVTGPTEALGLVNSGRVGGINALLSLLTDAPLALVPAGAGNITMFDITGAATGTPSVRTTGSQIYNEAVQLSLNTVLESTAGGNVVFTNTVDSRTATARSLEINTSGATRFGNVTGPTEALGLVNSGRVGGNFALLSLLTDAPAAGVPVVAGNITIFDITGAAPATPSVRTTGFQTYNDAVTLRQDTVLTSADNANVVQVGDIRFTSTVDSAAIATPRALTVNTGGDTVFGNGGADYVGGTAQLLSLTTDAGGRTILDIAPSALPNQISVTTQTFQNYGDNVELNKATVLNGTTFTFGGTVMGLGNDLTIRANPGNLNVMSTLTAGSIILGAADVTFTGAVSTVNALDIQVRTVAGGSGFLQGSDLPVPVVAGACIILGNNVTTAGFQTYLDCVKLTNDVILASTGGGNIQFNSTVDSFDATARALTVNTGGVTGFGDGLGDDRVGAMNALLSLTTDVGGSTVFNVDPTVPGFANTVRTTTFQTYNDAVVLTLNTVLTSANNANVVQVGDIRFNSTVNSLSNLDANARSLAVNTGGVTGFGDGLGDDRVGATAALLSLATDVGGSTVFNVDPTVPGFANTVRTTTFQTYNDAVVLTLNTVLTSANNANVVQVGDIRFNSTVNSLSNLDANARSLAVNTGGVTGFGDGLGDDRVGATAALLSLVTDAGGSTVFNVDPTVPGFANTVRTTTFQTYNDAVVLTLNTVLTSANNANVVQVGDIRFNSTVDSFSNLDVNARSLAVNTGGVTGFGDGLGDDRVGATAALLSLTTDAGGSTVFNVDPTVPGFANTVRTTTFQTYGDAVVLALDTVLTSANNANVVQVGDIQFNSTVDSFNATPRALTVNTGGVTGFGDGVGDDRIGAVNALLSLTTDDVAAVADGLGVGQERTVFKVDPTVGGFANTVLTTGPQTYGDAVVLALDTVFRSTGAGALGNIQFNSSVDSQTAAARSLTVNTGGVTGFGNGAGDDRVGAANALLNLTTDDDAAAANGVVERTEFNVDPTVPGFVNTVLTTGTQTYNDAVVLLRDTVVRSTGAGPLGDIRFTSTVDSAAIATPRALTVNTGGDTVFGNGGADYVGGTAQLLSLTTDAGGRTILDIAPSALPNQISVTTQTFQNCGDNVELNKATVLNGTTFTFGGTVMGLGNDLTIRANPGNLNVMSTLTAGSIILGAADVTFTGAVSTVNALDIQVRTVAGGSGFLQGSDLPVPVVAGACIILGNNVTTAGFQTYLDCVKLTNDVILASTGGGNIQFNSTVDSFDATARALTVNTGGVTGFGDGFGDDRVGAMNALLSLTTDVGGSTVFNVDPTVGGFDNTVRTTTFQTYNDAVRLARNTLLRSTLGGDVTFTNTVDSFDATARSLEVNTAGATRFGNSDGLALPGVFANATSGRVGGNFALLSVLTDMPGSTVFDITGAATATPTVRTTGFQTYNDAVALAQNTVLTSTGAGDVSFTNTVDSFNATPRSLEVNTAGATRFGNTNGLALAGVFANAASGRVGGTFALLSMLTDGPGSTVFDTGGASTATPTVRTTTFQTYNDAVTLVQNTVLTSTGSGDVTFTGTVDSLNAAAPRSLEVNTAGATRFGNSDGLALPGVFANATSGRVGGNFALLSVLTDMPGSTVFDITGAATATPTVRTTGFQTYNDAVALAQNTVLTSTGAGDVSFTNTVDSFNATPRSLEVNTAGATRFGNTNGLALAGVFANAASGRVGGTFALLSMLTDGPGSTVFDTGGASTATPTVRTTTFQTYNDAVTLVQNTVLTSTAAGDVTFTSTVNSLNATPQRLEVNTAGATRFGNANGLALPGVSANATSGRVGGLFALSGVLTDGPGSTVFDITGGGTATPTVTTTGFQTYNDAVVLRQNTVLTSTGAGDVSFTNTVDSFTATPRSLEINTGGATRFGNIGGLALPGAFANATSGRVGGISALSSVLTDAPLALVPAGAGNITIFDVDAPLPTGSVTGAPTVRTTGFQIYNDAVVLAQNTVLESTGTGNVVFTRTVDSRVAGSERSLEVNTAGTTQFGNASDIAGALATVTSGQVGRLNGGVQLLSLQTDAPGAAAGSRGGGTIFDVVRPADSSASVATIGSQTYNDAVTLRQNTLLQSIGNGGINLNSTVTGNVNGFGQPLVGLHLLTGGTATLGDSISNLTTLTPQVTGLTTVGTAGKVLPTTISLPSDLLFIGPVEILGNVAVAISGAGSTAASSSPFTAAGAGNLNTGKKLTFLSTVDGPGNLSVTAEGVVAFAGTVGGGASLDFLDVTAPIIQIQTTRTQNDLKLRTTLANGSDGSDGLVVLMGGAYTSLNGNVLLNWGDRPVASRHATILRETGDLAISAAGQFFMGSQQKLLVNSGSLTITAGGSATLGDLAASTSMRLSAGSVFLQGRPLSGFQNQNRADNGLGFVSPTITFTTSSIAFLTGTNQKAVFSTKESIASVRQISGVSLEIDKDLANQFGQQDLEGGTNRGIVQPLASGTRVTESSQIKVVFVLEIPKLVELPENTFLSRADQKILEKMGIYPRDATTDENITVSLRQGVFRQPIEGTPQDQMLDAEYKVVVNRLTTGEVKAIVEAYKTVAGDEFENLQKIAVTLGEQVGKYQAANPGALGLDGFTKWLQAQREADPAADGLAKDLDKLASVFVRLARIGLTKKEVTICKVKICDELKIFLPSNIEVWDVIPLIEGGANPPPKAPRPGATVPPADAAPVVVPPADGAPASSLPAPLPAAPEPGANPPGAVPATPATPPSPPSPDAPAAPKAQ